MHAGKNFSFKEVAFWTRRDILLLVIIATIPTTCYQLLGWTWLAIPWLPIALLGTAVAFVVGFKNNASYDRLWEARKAWGSIVNFSRSWGMLLKDYVTNKHALKPLSAAELRTIQLAFIHRHVAWLTALRFQLREARVWESIYKKYNQEYKNQWFSVPEHNGDLKAELAKHLTETELNVVMGKTNKAAQIIVLQSENLRQLFEQGYIEDFRHMELEKLLIEFYNQQGVCERIKNFPYPRQFATINLYFTRIFVFLVPLGMLQEFVKMGEHYVWMSIPFSALSSWIFTTLERIGESTESPFEGSANDVPITAMSRAIEIDLKEMFNVSDIPPPHQPENKILV